MPAFLGPNAPNALHFPSGRASGLPMPSSPFLSAAAASSVTLVGGRPLSYVKLYREQPWIAACVNLLGRQMARLPWKAFESLENGDRKRDRDSGLAALMAHPNREQGRSPVSFKWDIALDLLVQGNHVERIIAPAAGAEPEALEALDWRFLVPVLAQPEIGPILGWWYRPPSGRAEYLDRTDVVHWAWPGADGPIGVSPLAQLGVTIAAEIAMQDYSTASFRNGARIGVAAILDKDVPADSAARAGVREELIGNHSLEAAFSPAVLGGGIVDIKTIGGQTAVDVELIDGRKVNRDEIAAVYGAPQPLVGILDHATYGNVTEMHGILYKTVLGPWLSMLSATFGAQVIDRVPQWAGRFVEFDLGEVLKGDARERMESYKVGIGAGVYVLNDVRRMENLPPYAHPLAEEPLVMGNNVRPLDALGAGDDGGPVDDALRATLEQMVTDELESAGLNGSSASHAARIVENVAQAL